MRLLLLLLTLAASPALARTPAVQACATLMAAYTVQVEGLAAAVSSAQRHPNRPDLLERARTLHKDVRRALAEYVVAGCL